MHHHSMSQFEYFNRGGGKELQNPVVMENLIWNLKVPGSGTYYVTLEKSLNFLLGLKESLTSLNTRELRLNTICS